MLPPIADRFIAGEDRESALDHVTALNGRNIGGLLNYLGEHHTDQATVEADVEAYLTLIEALSSRQERARLSVKPTQLGLELGIRRFEANLETIVSAADEAALVVWIDMEDHTTTDATIDVFERLAATYGDRVGLCLQANLRRTHGDLERLLSNEGRLRLVKGGYDEPVGIAYQSRHRIDTAYRELLTRAIETGRDGIAVASHDEEMIQFARRLQDHHGTTIEFQFLMGVRETLQTDLARTQPVWQYVPYGERWLAYFRRRVTERTDNLRFALKAVIAG